MKIAQYKAYGGPEVVSVQTRNTPISKAYELLVKVHYTTITAADVRIREARFPSGFAPFARLVYGVRKPRRHVLGSIFSGIVEAVGPAVSGFKVGDEVCGSTGFVMGAHAEYVVVGEKAAVVQKPEIVSHRDAAAVLFGGSAALYFVRDRAAVQVGDQVLVNGALGAVGAAAVQLARHYGGTVFAVASQQQCSIARTLGAACCIDYEKDDMYASGTYDVVIDTVGNIDAKRGLTLLTEKGRLALMVASLREMFLFDKRVITGVATEKAEDFAFLLKLVAEGVLQPVVDSEWTLDTIVAAHERAAARGKQGVVVVRVSE